MLIFQEYMLIIGVTKKFLGTLLQRKLKTRSMSMNFHARTDTLASLHSTTMVSSRSEHFPVKVSAIFCQLSSHVSFSCPDPDLDLGTRPTIFIVSKFRQCAKVTNIDQHENFTNDYLRKLPNLWYTITTVSLCLCIIRFGMFLPFQLQCSHLVI